MGKIPVSRLKELRERKGLSQRSLAISIDKTENTVRNWENNRTSVDVFVTIAKLCEVLECTPGDLIGYVETEEVGEA